MNKSLPPTDGPRRLLFCCIENQCRSQMAEGFARLYGGDRVEAYSAGVRPAGRVHPEAVAAMREVGYDLTGHRSKGLAEVPDLEFDAVVTFGCADACSRVRSRRREDWGLPAPKNMPPSRFREVRDRIGERVRGLLTGLGIPGSLARPGWTVRVS